MRTISTLTLIPTLVLALIGCSSDSDRTGSTTALPATAPPTTALATTAPPTAPASAAASAPTTQLDPTATPDGDFPDVIAAEATREDAGTWRFDVTISSPYDSPERYADAWRVTGPDGTEFGIRILTHDHATEQPFTRSQTGISIPAAVVTVTVQGRDLVNGWGGGTLEITLPPG